MITLTSDLYLARGLHRECYIHPANPNRCVKVVVNGNQSETERELNYYQLLQKRGISWSMLPEFHGTVETDKGPGAIFDLVRDDNGTVSRSLADALLEAKSNHQLAQQLKQGLEKLKRYLLENAIVTMTIKPKNILCQRLADGIRLVIIDNVGNSDFIPLCNYSKFFARVKLKRKWARFSASL